MSKRVGPLESSLPRGEIRGPLLSDSENAAKCHGHAGRLPGGDAGLSALPPAISPKPRVPVNSSSWPGQDTRQLLA